MDVGGCLGGGNLWPKQENGGQNPLTDVGSTTRTTTGIINMVRWEKGYNPDHILASASIKEMFEKSVIKPFPHALHRQICVTVKPVETPQPTSFRRRINPHKAGWNGYSEDVDSLIN